jgi:glutamyl-tRNA reductase
VAKENGAVGGFLDLVMTRAFNVAKRVRSETEIGQSAVSVSYAAVELAREIFGSLKGKKVLVVGAGKMAESAARHLRRAGASEILVTNRTRERAVAMAEEVDGRVVDYEYFEDVVPEVDIVLASSGAPHFILTREQMRAAMSKRRNRPMFLIDIAVPRNIDPEVNKVESVFLYDIDDLGRVVNDNVRGRIETAKEAEEIIREEVDRMSARLRTRSVAPAIVQLQEEMEAWRKSEIERQRSKLGTMTPEQQELFEAFTRGFMNKVKHKLFSDLKKRAESE